MEFTSSLKMNYEFRRVYNKGRQSVQPCLVVYCRGNKGETNHLGITASTKLGHAVVRNKVRRRLREIYRLSESRLTRGHDIVVVARVRSVTADYKRLEREFYTACRALGIMGKERV